MKLAHNVFFTLKDNSPEAVAALVAACHKYLTVQPGVDSFACGTVCKELDREVNLLDWEVGIHMIFADKAAHDAYQVDATHNVFIAEQKANWSAVRVFDSLVK